MMEHDRLEFLVMQIFIRPPVYDNLLSQMTPISLASLCRVSRITRQATKDFISRAFNVNTRLARFFRKPCAFRSLQARTAAVISGSFAIQFFDRTYYPESDLDLYVHPDRSMLDIGTYLQAEGYVFQPILWQCAEFKDEVNRVCSYIDIEQEGIENRREYEQLYGMPSLRAVYTFSRNLEDGGEEVQKVQIVVSRTSPLASMLDFHSTCVMNVITYNAAYSLYPYATFEQREALVINDGHPQAQAALVKYAARGWRVVANPSTLVPYLERRAYHVGTPRWVCDSKSWIVKLNMDNVTPPPRLSPSSGMREWDPVAECGWTLTLHGCEAQVFFEVLHSTVMKWRYTTGSWEYWQSLVDFFVDQGRLEHRKILNGQTREQNPDIWTWWDTVLPVFRNSFQNDHSLIQR